MSSNNINEILKTVVIWLMKLYPSYPSVDDLSLWEIFKHTSYLDTSPEEQNEIKLRSAQYRYDYERQKCFFDKYFPDILTEEFVGKNVLDLGSFTGGRLVYWLEKYDFNGGYGIDINPVFAEAGKLFASKKQVNARFSTGFAEKLPYDSSTLDFIVSYDVLEHVQNVDKTMLECFRVLKPGGKLLVVFPQFLQPLESHLGLVTKMPALHWFFSSKILTAAYYDILKERGEQALWYTPELQPWEKLPSLNGITVSKFKRIIGSNKNWQVIYKGREPILRDGNKSKLLIFRLLSKVFALPARLPILEELFLGRICYILERTQ